MKPAEIDVFYPLPEGWGVCVSCEMVMARADLDHGPYERGLDDYPPEWQAEFHQLSDLILALSARYQEKILIRIWDPRSLQGLLKSIRYGVHRYPTFVVNKQEKLVGWDQAVLEEKVEAALSR